ncbi:hypothetical protein LINPERHAP2_LOCUS11728, partial [Linum perenne]
SHKFKPYYAYHLFYSSRSSKSSESSSSILYFKGRRSLFFFYFYSLHHHLYLGHPSCVGISCQSRSSPLPSTINTSLRFVD